MQLDYTIGPEVTSNPYHTNVVRAAVTRNIAAQFNDMHEEMILTFEELLPPDNHGISIITMQLTVLSLIKSRSPSDWIGIPMFPAIVKIMSRISARLSVGYPLCKQSPLSQP